MGPLGDRLNSMRRGSVVTIAVTMAAILLFALVSWHNYSRLRDAEIADAEGDAEHALLAVDDHVNHLIDYADSYLRTLRSFYVLHGGGDAFRAFIAETRMNDPESFLGEIAVADANGQVTFMLSRPDPPKTQLSDLGYFKTLQSGSADRIYIDWTRLGRAIREYQFRVVRPILVNGKFQGVILITLRPEEILKLFGQFGLLPNSNIAVLQSDAHRFIARLPVGDRGYFDKSFDSGDIWERLKTSNHGLYHTRSTIDHKDRYVTFRKSREYPIVSFVGVADEDIDATLDDSRRDIALEALFFIGGAIAICALVLRVIGVEDRLIRSHANLVHAQRLGKIGSVEVDLATGQSIWSDELYEIYGRDRALGPATLEQFLTYVHPDDHAVAETTREQQSTGEVAGPNEYRIVVGGEIRWIHREADVHRDATGRPIKLLSVEQDVTEQKRLELAKDSFVSTVSHELRTPLTSIRGALSLIAAGAAAMLPAKEKQLIDIAHRNSERLSHLVDDLLDLQRIAAGRMAYNMGETQVSRVIADAIEAIRPFASSRKVTITMGADCPDAVAIADPVRLGQVMDNLLSNAIKFSKPGQAVVVSLEHRPPWLRIAVEDHGEGIPEDFRERIFERFTQAESGDTRKSGGSGLGLSIAHAIVSHHGGQLSFDTEHGVGTRFYVDLREAAAAPAAETEPARSDAAS